MANQQDIQDCAQFGWWDPRRYICVGTSVVGGIADAANPANLVTGLTAGFASMLQGLVEAPFKALGIGGLNDALWRLMFIGLGFMLIAFGLLLFAGAAIKEETGGSAGQAGQQAAQAAAVAA
jgi:hypothetical protein